MLQSGFGGHRHEASGFVDLGGRQYDPSLGRFLSVDPFNVEPLNAQSYNGYAFVMGDPMTLSDPSGYCSANDPYNASDCGGLRLSWWNPEASGGGGFAGWLNRESASSAGNPGGRSGPPRVESRIVDIQQGAAPVASSGGVANTMNAGRAGSGGRRVQGDLSLRIANALDDWGVDDFAAGFGDFVSIGATRWLREATGINGTVDEDSGVYIGGEVVGFVASLPSMVRSGAAGVRWVATGGLGRTYRGALAFGRGAARVGAELIRDTRGGDVYRW